MSRIYLDHNATSPLRPVAKEAILEATSEGLANPNSTHGQGRKTRRRVDNARESVASFLGVKTNELIFTSGGTEANHLAWNHFQAPGFQVLTNTIEHPCVLAAAEKAKTSGGKVSYFGFDQEGKFKGSGHETEYNFLSFQMANNETGFILPFNEIQSFVKSQRVHVDAVQLLGKGKLAIADLGIDYLSLSAHKLGALNGVGALYKKKGAPLKPLWLGGPQERGRRAGTENVLGIIALGVVCEFLEKECDQEARRIEKLRNAFERGIVDKIKDCHVVHQHQERLVNTSNIIFRDADAEALLIAADLEGIEVSTGAACSSGSLEPSHVLLNMGYAAKEAKSAIRFSMGWNTSELDVEKVLDIFPSLVKMARGKGVE